MPVYGCGSNAKGQLDPENDFDIKIPKIIHEDCQVLCGGSNHSLFLRDGRLYSLGDNSLLQSLEYHSKVLDIACGWNTSFIITENGTFVCGQGYTGWKQLPLQNIVKISCGWKHVLFLSRDGLVYGMGSNKYHQLANLSADFQVIFENASDIACGQYHSLVLSQGKIHCFGRNQFGQLGVLEKTFSNIVELDAIKVFSSWSTSGCITCNGCYLWGRNDYGQAGYLGPKISPIRFVPELVNVKDVSMGSEHGICLFNDGTCASWGWNEHGMCGHPEPIIAPPRKLLAGIQAIGTGAGHSLFAS